ncbi:hypothetical protein Ahy_B06g085391 isoform B [Arachis hypogaea]|uniref:Uncharacterized protein n=1 Tax=Arachis hypogaea TaxID=3818 RepID=A0A444YUC0_ARAHY|nr:hypothetical protein Ahy_B06g085391 isoform B [Arachis hypogaea]
MHSLLTWIDWIPPFPPPSFLLSLFQPALLYIVPAVIGSLAVHCIWNADVKQLLEFDESKIANSSQEGSDPKSSKKVE